MNSKMMDAFIAQTYGSYENISAKEAQSQDVLNKVQEIRDGWRKEAKDTLSRSQNISDYIEIPTNLNPEESIKKTESHQHFGKYDHSLEMDRLSILREKYNYIEPEKIETKDVEELEMSTEAYENIDPSEIPNLNGIFDNVFESK